MPSPLERKEGEGKDTGDEEKNTKDKDEGKGKIHQQAIEHTNLRSPICGFMINKRVRTKIIPLNTCGTRDVALAGFYLYKFYMYI